jgi:predicted kinase
MGKIMGLPTLIMLVGIPGSGKSTILSGVDPLVIIVCPDTIRKELYGNVTDQTHNIEVWAEAKARTIKHLNEGIGVILDATNVNTTNRRNFLQGLPPCKLQAILFKTDPDQCWKRIKKDIDSGKDRSNVPEEIIYRMYGEFLYTEKVIESEGFEIYESCINWSPKDFINALDDMQRKIDDQK